MKFTFLSAARSEVGMTGTKIQRQMEQDTHMRVKTPRASAAQGDLLRCWHGSEHQECGWCARGIQF